MCRFVKPEPLFTFQRCSAETDGCCLLIDRVHFIGTFGDRLCDIHATQHHRPLFSGQCGYISGVSTKTHAASTMAISALDLGSTTPN